MGNDQIVLFTVVQSTINFLILSLVKVWQSAQDNFSTMGENMVRSTETKWGFTSGHFDRLSDNRMRTHQINPR